MEITQAHRDIFDFVRAPKRCVDGFDHHNLIVNAVAGSGKTTTLMECLKLVPRGNKTIVLAFNKSVSDELAQRVKTAQLAANVKTLNAVGYGAWMSRNERTSKMDPKKAQSVVADQVRGRMRLSREGYTAIRRLLDIARASGIVPDVQRAREQKMLAEDETVNFRARGLVEDSDDSWYALIDRHGLLDAVRGELEVSTLREIAWEALWNSVIDTKRIDFNDQLYMPYAYDLPFYQYDWIFVDEVQDLSPLQHDLIKRMTKPTTRIVAVGDEHQAIYGWRGADSDSMRNFQEMFRCHRLPLDVSYRCPQRVVREAQAYVPHIEAHPSAPVGFVLETENYKEVDYHAGDMVLCRKNAPLVQIAVHVAMQCGLVVRILGKDDVGSKMVGLVEKFKARDIDDLLRKLDDWVQRETQENQEDPERAEEIRDLAAALRAIAEVADDVPDLIEALEGLFIYDDALGGDVDESKDDGKRKKERVDPKSVVLLSSIHRAKGREARRVYLVDMHKMPSPLATQEWQKQQEMNLAYVAVTRAQECLQYVWTEDPSIPPTEKGKRR